jgi:hypothetical protein
VRLALRQDELSLYGSPVLRSDKVSSLSLEQTGTIRQAFVADAWPAAALAYPEECVFAEGFDPKAVDFTKMRFDARGVKHLAFGQFVPSYDHARVLCSAILMLHDVYGERMIDKTFRKVSDRFSESYCYNSNIYRKLNEIGVFTKVYFAPPFRKRFDKPQSREWMVEWCHAFNRARMTKFAGYQAQTPHATPQFYFSGLEIG